MIKSILFALLCCLSLFSFAQNTVLGKVSDSKNKPLEFVNVVLYQLPDSTFIKGTTTESDGTFEIEKVKNGNYFLKTMMLSYNDFTSETFDLSEINSSYNAKIKMFTNSAVLDEVEIVAKKPMLVQEVDKLVVNVADHITGSDGNLMDVLKKVPGMIVVNDQLNLAGKGNPTILIDGRTTKYMDLQSLLKEMPGDNIEKIEVIHQPGAEYEASGTGPIINIILKKNKLFGTNGSVTYHISKGEKWRNRARFSLNSRQGKWNFYGSANAGKNNWHEELIISRDLQVQETSLFYFQSNYNPSIPNSLRANFGADYYINDKQTIGVSVSGITSKNYRDNIADTKITEAFTIDTAQIITTNSLESDWKNVATDLYYSIELDTSGQKLAFDFATAFFDRTFNTLVVPDAIKNTGSYRNLLFDRRNYRPGNTSLYTLKADYTLPITKDFKIFAGAKLDRANILNDLKVEEKLENEWKENENQSNQFEVKENIYAAYVKSNFKLGKWDLSAGLRYEDSNTEGYSVTLDSLNTRKIKQLFPSASLGRAITKQLGFTMSYSYRIDRPRYSSLNPFIYYLDPFTKEVGNPQLKPEFTHSGKFNLTFDNQPFFSLEYSKTNDIITLITQQEENSEETIAFDDNIDELITYGGSLFFPLDFTKVATGYGGFFLNFNEYTNVLANGNFNAGAPTLTAFIQAKFKLPWEVNSELSGWYSNGGQDGIINYEWMYGVSVGFEKKFLDDKLSVQTGVNDIFNRFFYGDLNYDNTLARINSIWDAQVIYLNLKYNFGNKFLKDRKGREKSGKDILNRAKED